MSLNYLLFVPAAASTVALMSAANPAGPFTEDLAATIDPATKTVTVPQSGSARFYRLRQPLSAPTITSIRAAGTNIIITYTP